MQTDHRSDETTDPMARYQPVEGSYDQLLDGTDVRTHWASVSSSLGELGTPALSRRVESIRRRLEDDGVGYNATVGDKTVARPWVLDPIPEVLAPEDWRRLEAGLAQRARLFDLILADLYGPRRLIGDGLLPAELVYSDPGFLRECDQVRLPGECQLFVAAFDLARRSDGTWVVISARTEAPSGIGYALANRMVLTRVMPELYTDTDVVRLAAFFHEFRTSLQRVAPTGVESPRIVVLSPGPLSETAFEHSLLASYLGYPLVQGGDLRVRDGRVWERTLERLEPVHVILRRVDATWCDPLELRPDSTLGAPGLLEAARVGNVSIVNPPGSGVLENPALLSFLPQLSRVLLDEDLIVDTAPTWWCGDPASLSHVEANLERLILRPVGGSDRAAIAGSALSSDERDDLTRRIRAEPLHWVGQEAIPLASTPTFHNGVIEARGAVLRGFALATDDGYSVMPGGLTRVAPSAEQLIVTNQNGAWSKDTWVLAGEPELPSGLWLQLDAPDVVPDTAMSQRGAENMFWLSRYAERAEDLVRLIRVVADRRAEAVGATTPALSTALEVLFRALTETSTTYPGFIDAAMIAQPVEELRALVVDAQRPGTVAHSLDGMLAAATQTRDQLSNDTWLVIGHLHRNIDALSQRPGGVDSQSLGGVMAALLALAGLSAESNVRDAGWQFLEAGRRIERALQLCALMSATITERRGGAIDGLVFESVLTTSESIVTYRRRYRSRATLATVLDLLILDGGNPRSLLFQVRALSEAVRCMPRPETGDGIELDALIDELGTAVSLADTDALARPIEAGDSFDPTVPQQLAVRGFLTNVSSLLEALADRIDAAHFFHQLPQRPVVRSLAMSQGGGRP